ncbi:MAG: acyl-CoA dehydrogenase family protein [Actinomycetota bacterium]|nr:acyl-CoA dehydrogenase family protein [Actinomycetota bacterium]
MAKASLPIHRLISDIENLIVERAKSSDAARRPDPDVIAALANAGLMRLLVPQEYGGHEVHPATVIDFTAQLAQIDGSTAWVAMTCNEEAELVSAYLPPETCRRVWNEEPNLVFAGSGVPKGRAVRAPGGWRITGRWNFVSGCTAADKWVLNSVVSESSPIELCFAVMDANQQFIEDTWHTVGLRGTGSHDVVLEDVFVDDAWCGVVPNKSLPLPDLPFYRLPSALRFPFPKTGVACGLARRAMAEFKSLAGTKQPLNSKRPLSDRPDAASAIAKAEALVGSGQAWVHEQLDLIWRAAENDETVASDVHARVRLACSWSVQNAISAIQHLVDAAGSTANFEASGLMSLLDDARAVAGHFMVGSYQVDTAGRVLLGLDAGDPAF